MAKILLFEKESLTKIKAGVEKIGSAVGVTMGPNGKNVIISRNNALAVTKDGVTVASEIQLEDPIEAVGAELIKQISRKTAIEAGDGTTTSTVLASSIFLYGLDQLDKGINPIEMKVGMELQVKKIVSKLKKISIPIKVGDTKTIKNIASISANNDSVIGELIADAFSAIGFNGVISVRESKTAETFIEIADGLQFDQGYVSPFFIMNEKSKVEFEKPLIFIYDGKINTFNEIFKLLEYASNTKSPIVFICDGIDAEALNAILVNCMKANLKACVVKAPAYGEQRFNMLLDIATVIGGGVISEKDGVHISEVITPEQILKYKGSCDKIEIDSKSTTIIGGKGSAQDIEIRVNQIREAANSEQNTSNQLILQERAARLSDGVAILKVGANSELELKEKLERIDDSLSATRAAIAEGYIPGGGSILYDLSKKLKTTSKNPNIQAGIDVINNACRIPLKIIANNSGKTLEYVEGILKKGYGYNAKTDKVEKLIKSGVIDPVKVTRCSLENALSVASLMLTTGCMMVQTTENALTYNPNL